MSYPTRPGVGGRVRRGHSPAGTRTELDLLNTGGAHVITWHAPPNSTSAHALDQLRESLPKIQCVTAEKQDLSGCEDVNGVANRLAT